MRKKFEYRRLKPLCNEKKTKHYPEVHHPKKRIISKRKFKRSIIKKEYIPKLPNDLKQCIIYCRNEIVDLNVPKN